MRKGTLSLRIKKKKKKKKKGYVYQRLD